MNNANADVMIKGNARNFGVLLTEYMVTYYDVKYFMDIETPLDNDISALNENLDIIVKQTAEKPYCLDGFIGSMNFGPNGNTVIIEDYHDNIDIIQAPWESIAIDENLIYHNESKGLLICKNKKYYKDLFEHNFL